MFCYPQSSYKLFIECENGKIEKTIELKPLDGFGNISVFPAGLQYVLILNFHPFNVVEGVCTLKEWNAIFDEETQAALYKEQKSSTTVVKETKVYPNDPCHCGSGKKYKKCCGRN